MMAPIPQLMNARSIDAKKNLERSEKGKTQSCRDSQKQHSLKSEDPSIILQRRHNKQNYYFVVVLWLTVTRVAVIKIV